MIVEGLRLRGFTSLDEVEVEFPPAGLTLVTGPNGAGKSSLIEAVSWGAWGRTIRGADPWGEGPCEVALVTEGHAITRQRAGGRGALSWRRRNQIEFEYESPTLAQEALSREVLPRAVWRRAFALSSADSSHFMEATDAERKRLIELLFDLDVFDRALDLARADLASSREGLAGARARLAAARAAERSAADEGARLAALPEPAGPGEPEAEVAARAAERVVDLAESAPDPGGVGEAAAAQGEAAARLRQAEVRHRAAQGGVCGACGQEVPAAAAAAAAAELAEARAGSEFAQAAWRAASAAQRAAAEARRAARAALEEARAELAAARQASALRGQRLGLLEEAGLRHIAAARELAAALGGVERASAAEARLRGCEEVLGVRGVRSRLLDRVLSGLEEVANAHLDRVHDRARLELRSQTELADGRVVGKISAEVVGVGGRGGYRAASGGERRLVNAALALALGDAVAAARGMPRATLFCDEVFDALDAGRAEAFAAVLREVAGGRHVVVVSHSESLARALEPDRHLRVEDGRVREV